jgi:SAM-dependent methyltransferase
MNQPYRWLALYYDQLFGGFMPWSRAARDAILGPILPEVKSACDIGCGTGTTALELAGRGIRMFGVDLAPLMCREARRKVREAGLPVRILHADMRSFRLPEPVDLVLCEFDAINHVPHKSDLARVAGSVARALGPGGHFYFDANNRRAFEKIWPSTWWHEVDGAVLVMHGGYDRARDKGWTDCEWFLRQGRHWQRRREHIEQVWWTAREVRETLRAAGFDRIRAWDARAFYVHDTYIEPGCRTMYLARKA